MSSPRKRRPLLGLLGASLPLVLQAAGLTVLLSTQPPPLEQNQ